MYMTGFYMSINKGATGITAREVDGVLLYNPEPNAELTNFLTKHTFGKIATGTSDGQPHEFKPYKSFHGPGILKIKATADTKDTDVSAGFNCYIVTK